MKKSLTWLRSGWFISLLGLLLIAVLIWLGGPYLGIGKHQPLASATARLALILLLLLIWLAGLQIIQWRARRKTAKLSTELAGQEANVSDEASNVDGQRERLQARFQEAIATLRKTRWGHRNLYALPWYLLIGPPGSGKSTLLENSGLEFPLLDRFGKAAVRGIGGTRDCDWWFTDEAVFLDTAGRYTTQESDAAADAGAWQAFLGLLRRYRRRRPLNGVIVSMSMADLLIMDEDECQRHVRAVRRRLDELTEQLKLRVPVYLMFTKSDLVAGFSEFFDDLGAEQRNQVWGMTFPVERTRSGDAAALFDSEFDLLLERLNTRVIERLHNERDRGRRAVVLSFPQQMAGLRTRMLGFVEGVFVNHRYGETPLLRGVYLTSGTQEGAPIDRMLAAVAQTFGVDVAQLPPTVAAPRTFFVQRLLKDVLLRESGFAALHPKRERYYLILQAATYVGVVLSTLLLIFAFSTSYVRNRAYLDEVRSALKDFPANAADLANATTLKSYLAHSLLRLEILDGAEQSAAQHQGHVPWLMRFGLYQGTTLTEQVHGAYRRELDGTLWPAVDLRFRDGVSASASDPSRLYDYLKGYLMMGEPPHVSAPELAALARVEWRRLFPDDTEVQKALNRHFSALLGDSPAPRALALDAELVAQARATLKTADLATLIYASVKLRADRSGASPVRLDQTLGLLGNVFQRRSGTPLSAPLPGLFTRPMFAAEASQGISEAVEQFAKDDWVLGEQQIDPLARSRLGQQVLELYQRDYIQTWDALLADLELRPVTSIQDASATAAKLAGPSSPLKALLVLVGDNTSDLMREAEPEKGDPAAATGKAANVGKQLASRRLMSRSYLARELRSAGVGRSGQGTAADNEEAASPGAAIEAHFAPLNQLGAGGAGAAPINRTLGMLDQLSKHLLSLSGFNDPAVQADPVLLEARQATDQLPPKIGGMLGSLTGRSADLVASSASKSLSAAARQAAGNDCSRFIQGRYPFQPASSSDIPLQNFADLFGNGGRFDSFFKETLSPLVNTGGSTWRWKEGAVPGSPGVLGQAQLAYAIRKIYFRGGRQPEVDFTVRVLRPPVGISALQLDVDGQHYDYAGGNDIGMAMKWPGSQPGHVTLAAKDTAGNALPSVVYRGEWSLFHALDAAHLRRQGDLLFIADFVVGGHKVELEIKPASLQNPFLDERVRRFRCTR